jgi:hypothetical protein
MGKRERDSGGCGLKLQLCKRATAFHSNKVARARAVSNAAFNLYSNCIGIAIKLLVKSFGIALNCSGIALELLGQSFAAVAGDAAQEG